MSTSYVIVKKFNYRNAAKGAARNSQLKNGQTQSRQSKSKSKSDYLVFIKIEISNPPPPHPPIGKVLKKQGRAILTK